MFSLISWIGANIDLHIPHIKAIGVEVYIMRFLQNDKWSIGIIGRIAASIWLLLMVFIPFVSDRPYMVRLFEFRYVALACAVIGAVFTRRRWVSIIFAVMTCVVGAIALIRPR